MWNIMMQGILLPCESWRSNPTHRPAKEFSYFLDVELTNLMRKLTSCVLLTAETNNSHFQNSGLESQQSDGQFREPLVRCHPDQCTCKNTNSHMLPMYENMSFSWSPTDIIPKTDS